MDSNQSWYEKFWNLGWALVLAVVFLIVSVSGLIWWGMGVSARNQAAQYEVTISKSQSDLQILQERKITLLDELIGTAKAGVASEKNLLTSVISLRNSPDTTNVAASLKILVEAYPDLKSLSNFGTVMTEMSITENGISTQKQYTNSQITAYNLMFKQWPTKDLLSDYPKVEYALYETKMDVLNWKPSW